MTESRKLLHEYAQAGSEAAFRELVSGYLGLVYSAALRLVEGDSHRAEDVAQTVFMDLARMAGTLSKEVMLGGWLHRHTCFVAANVMRGERRRQVRERQAVEMNALQNNSDADFSPVAPILDEAINELGEVDRTAILLRFFEQRDFRSLGQALGSNEDAARMRVNRALEKLESLLKKRGVRTSVAGLGMALSVNAIQAVPAGLAATISTAAATLAGTGIAASAASATTKATIATMSLFNAKTITAIVASAIVAGTGTYFVQQSETNRLRRQTRSLLEQQGRMIEERDGALTAASAKEGELARSRSENNDLLRLRGEIGTLRAQVKELEKLRQQNRQLQASLAKANSPAQEPETDPDGELQRQMAIAKMSDAKALVLGLLMYADANQDRLPADFDAATNYLGKSEQTLTGTNQFELLVQGSLADITNRSVVIAVREKEPLLVKGKWIKTYGFADGHAEVRVEPPEGFDAWEKRHMVVPSGTP